MNAQRAICRARAQVRRKACTATNLSATSPASSAPTPNLPSRHLWQFLRAEHLGVKFRRQAAIGEYIVDFVCFPRKLIIELDGPQHLESAAQEHDRQRTTWLTSQGFRVLRFRNHELDEDIHAVIERISLALAECEA